MRDVVYGPAGRENTLDVYYHRGKPVGCPVLVYFHPGGFFSGRKSRQSRALFDRLVCAGWVCVTANYRLRRAGEFPNNLIDAKRVIAYIRSYAADYGADPTTLIVCGGSAGAYLSAMCAVTANTSTFQPGFEEADTSVSAAIGLYGWYGSAPISHTTSSDLADYVRSDAAPFFIIHGDHDPMIDPVNARAFVGRLRAASSAPTLYAELPGGQHNFDQFSSIRYTAVVDAIATFAAWVRASSPSNRDS